MNITFNLNDANVYIPNGRLMNLKHELQWDLIYSLDSDFSRKKILDNKFNIDFDFSHNFKKLLKNFIDRYKEERQYGYSFFTKNTLMNLSMEKIEYNISIDNIDTIMDEVKKGINKNSIIQAKIKKLKQLKEINNLS